MFMTYSWSKIQSIALKLLDKERLSFEIGSEGYLCSVNQRWTINTNVSLYSLIDWNWKNALIRHSNFKPE